MMIQWRWRINASLLRGSRRVAADLGGELYPEIAALWGLGLALFLEWEGERLGPDEIAAGVIVTIVELRSRAA